MMVGKFEGNALPYNICTNNSYHYNNTNYNRKVLVVTLKIPYSDTCSFRHYQGNDGNFNE